MWQEVEKGVAHEGAHGQGDEELDEVLVEDLLQTGGQDTVEQYVRSPVCCTCMIGMIMTPKIPHREMTRMAPEAANQILEQ